MDWSAFPSDFLAATLGVFVALGLDRWLEHGRAKRRDVRLVQNLIDRIAGKRAFSHSRNVGLVDDPVDRERCVASILDTRLKIAAVCDEIEVREDCVSLIRQMESDCSAYLNHVESHGDEYAIALIRLRDRLELCERRIQERMPDLVVTAPGERRPDNYDWLT